MPTTNATPYFLTRKKVDRGERKREREWENCLEGKFLWQVASSPNRAGELVVSSLSLTPFLRRKFPPKFETPIEIPGILIWPSGQLFCFVVSNSGPLVQQKNPARRDPAVPLKLCERLISRHWHFGRHRIKSTARSHIYFGKKSSFTKADIFDKYHLLVLIYSAKLRWASMITHLSLSSRCINDEFALQVSEECWSIKRCLDALSDHDGRRAGIFLCAVCTQLFECSLRSLKYRFHVELSYIVFRRWKDQCTLTIKSLILYCIRVRILLLLKVGRPRFPFKSSLSLVVRCFIVQHSMSVY